MQQTSLDRRTLAKGAAWAAPALTIAAAAPILAASPVCSDCVIPVLSVSATTLTKPFGFPLPANGTVTMAAPFTFNVTGCTGLISLNAVTISSAVLTMNSGLSYTSGAIGVGPGRRRPGRHRRCGQLERSSLGQRGIRWHRRDW